jgi:Fic family protein
MAPRPSFRQQVRREALLFNSNSLHDVLRALASVDGEFHAAALSRASGHSRAQTKAELAKLRALGVVDSRGAHGRVERLYLADDPLVDAILELPDLIADRLARLDAP